MTYKSQHVYDALPSAHDPRDYRMMFINTAALPEQYSLPSVPILDQANEGACVGHGCAGARETLEIIWGNPPPLVPLSRAFIYFKAREFEGTQNQDAGAEVRDGCRVLQTLGCPTEETFPYRAGEYAKVPPDADLTEAAQYKIGSYARLNSSDEIRAVISSGVPVVIGVSVYASFERQIGPDGRVPIPAPSDTLLGGHCMFLSGYLPDPQNIGMFLFRCQNSWGPDWADHGCCWMPEGYLNNPNLCTDIWSISL